MDFNTVFIITAIFFTGYNLNVVGYINLPLHPGYNLITLPLQSSDPASSINSVLTNTTPVVPFGASVATWGPALQTWAQCVYAGGDGNWYDKDFTYLATNPLPPGTGFFLYLPAAAETGVSNLTVTCVGSVLQGTNSISVPGGYGFYGNFEPIQGDLTTNGFPITETGSYLFRWNSAQQKYTSYVYGVDAADNSPNPPQFYDQNFATVQVVAPALGEGFIYYNAGASADWTQVFEVQ